MRPSVSEDNMGPEESMMNDNYMMNSLAQLYKMVVASEIANSL